MRITTKVFGDVEIDDNKIITFPKGIIGFPELTKFTLVYNSERGTGSIQWLQSLDEPAFAMPVMDPLLVKDNYNPSVDDDLVEDVKPLEEDNVLVLVTVTVPRDLKQMTVNLKGPIIINTETRKGVQIILNDDTQLVKFPIYDILQKAKEAAE